MPQDGVLIGNLIVSPSDLLTGIAHGKLDEYLEQINRVACERMRNVRAQRDSIAAATILVGDRVQVQPVPGRRSKWDNQTGVVAEVMRSGKIRVTLDGDGWHTRAGTSLRCPASMLSKIEQPAAV